MKQCRQLRTSKPDSRQSPFERLRQASQSWWHEAKALQQEDTGRALPKAQEVPRQLQDSPERLKYTLRSAASLKAADGSPCAKTTASGARMAPGWACTPSPPAPAWASGSTLSLRGSCGASWWDMSRDRLAAAVARGCADWAVLATQIGLRCCCRAWTQSSAGRKLWAQRLRTTLDSQMGLCCCSGTGVLGLMMSFGRTERESSASCS